MISDSSQHEFLASKEMVSALKKEAQQVVPSLAFRSILREKLEMVVGIHERLQLKTRHAYGWFTRSYKALSAGVLMVAFFVATVFNFALSPTITQASVRTLLEDVSGEVVIVRDGNSFPAHQGFLLKEDDQIKTGEDSRAIVRFLDDSVSRLDENTAITISELSVNPRDKTETNVEVTVQQGRLWSRVISLINNWSSFQVKSGNVVTVAKRRAAFDVAINNEGKTSVTALHNRVDVKVSTPTRVVQTNLLKGYVAEVKTPKSLAPSITKIDEKNIDEAQWVKSNLSQDEVYIAGRKQDAQHIANAGLVTSDNPLYALKQLSQSTQLALSLSDLDKQRKLIVLADTKLAEAQSLFQRKDNGRAQDVLNEFKEIVLELGQWVHDHQASNPDEAGQIKVALEETLHSYKKQFSLLLPTDDLYVMKEAIVDAQLASAGNPAEKAEQKLEAAADKLFEVHDLAEEGNHPLVKEQLADYSKTVAEVVNDAKQLPDAQKEKAVSAIIDSKVEDIKVLDALALTIGKPIETTVDKDAAAAKNASETTEPTATTPAAQDETLTVTMTAPTLETPVVPTIAVKMDSIVKDAVDETKTDVLTQLGEAVLDAQKIQTSSIILGKLQQIEQTDSNGSSFVNVTVTQKKVTITTDSKVISVTEQGQKTFDLRPAAEELKDGIIPPTEKDQLPTMRISNGRRVRIHYPVPEPISLPKSDSTLPAESPLKP